MKNRFLKVIATVLIVMSGTSCGEYLDVVPDNIAVIEDAFETRQNADRFLATVYGYMPPLASPSNPALVGGDEIVLNTEFSQRTYNSQVRISNGGQSVANPFLGYWGSGAVDNLFVALRDCNIFLDNVDKPFDLLEDEKVRWIAEAKTLKAFYHFYLMRMYGPIPIVDRNIEVSEGVEAVRVERDPVDEVGAYIVQLLDEAIPNLPDQVLVDNTDLGRITKPIAAGLKAKVLLTLASPLFNGNTDYSSFVNKAGEPLISQVFDAKKWEDAATACQEAIDIAEAAGHGLYEFDEEKPGYSDTTKLKLSIRGAVSERWNKEVVWGSSHNTTGFLQSLAQARIVPGLNGNTRESVTSSWAPPIRIAEMFYSENGVPIDEDVNYNYAERFNVSAADESHENYVQTGFETANLHLNREPRFYASIGFDGGVWEGHGVDEDANHMIVNAKFDERAGRKDRFRFSATGYFAKKLVYYTNVQSTVTGVGYTQTTYPFPIIRMADLYLAYAEALNESAGPAGAIPWIDRVRTRAGLDGVTESWTNHSNDPSKPTTKEGLREIIQQERMIELVFEGHRFWDLRRWKRAQQFLSTPARGWNIEGATTQSFYNVVPVRTYQFLRRDYLWPISETDMVRNNNLIQNPGW